MAYNRSPQNNVFHQAPVGNMMAAPPNMQAFNPAVMTSIAQANAMMPQPNFAVPPPNMFGMQQAQMQGPSSNAYSTDMVLSFMLAVAVVHGEILLRRNFLASMFISRKIVGLI